MVLWCRHQWISRSVEVDLKIRKVREPKQWSWTLWPSGQSGREGWVDLEQVCLTNFWLANWANFLVDSKAMGCMAGGRGSAKHWLLNRDVSLSVKEVLCKETTLLKGQRIPCSFCHSFHGFTTVIYKCKMFMKLTPERERTSHRGNTWTGQTEDNDFKSTFIISIDNLTK